MEEIRAGRSSSIVAQEAFTAAMPALVVACAK
jgi:hypothetical protein